MDQSSETGGDTSFRDKLNFKEFGQKGIAPLVDVLNKYRGEIDPYFSSIGIGLRGAADSIEKDGGEESIASWFRELSTWSARGELVQAETLAEGLEQAPSALRGLFEGRNLGKQLFRVSAPV